MASGIFNAMDVAASGMTAQRTRLDIISQNLANVNTTRDEYGRVYRRQTVVFRENSNSSFDHILSNKLETYDAKGVKIAAIVEDTTEGAMVYDPMHPDADENGYVTLPNVNTVTEMTNMIDASRSYEANATAFNAAKSMAMKGLELFD
ncbi:MAG: flagellar basal body rod protein FlgC [Lachnospiraceae bacterium]|nr:flagellar basal body rod protein FlgC [Lachnospiraceae bacterium]MDE6627020.1 flagellar basal body rod protein FlgC [Lachnospiraceae bacterium]